MEVILLLTLLGYSPNIINNILNTDNIIVTNNYKSKLTVITTD